MINNNAILYRVTTHDPKGQSTQQILSGWKHTASTKIDGRCICAWKNSDNESVCKQQMKDLIQKGDDKMCSLFSIKQSNKNKLWSNVRNAIFEKFKVPIDSRSAIKTIHIRPNHFHPLALQDGNKGPLPNISIGNSKLFREKGIDLYCYARESTEAGVFDEIEEFYPLPNTLEWSTEFFSNKHETGITEAASVHRIVVEDVYEKVAKEEYHPNATVLFEGQDSEFMPSNTASGSSSADEGHKMEQTTRDHFQRNSSSSDIQPDKPDFQFCQPCRDNFTSSSSEEEEEVKVKPTRKAGAVLFGTKPHKSSSGDDHSALNESMFSFRTKSHYEVKEDQDTESLFSFRTKPHESSSSDDHFTVNEDPDTESLFSYTTKEKNLLDLCQTYGAVNDVNLLMDEQNPTRSKGRAYIVFQDEAGAEGFVKNMNEKSFQGRQLRINVAADRPRSGRDSIGGGRKAGTARYWEKDITTKCFRCGGVGHMASACPNEQLAKPCPLCAKTGHDSYSCPLNRICFNCGIPGHINRECTERRGMPRRIVCGACFISGHHRWECRERIHNIPAYGATCLVCRKDGHFMCDSMKWFFGLKGISCFNCGRKGHHGSKCDRPVVDECARNSDLFLKEFDRAEAKSLEDELEEQRQKSREENPSHSRGRDRNSNSRDRNRTKSQPPSNFRPTQNQTSNYGRIQQSSSSSNRHDSRSESRDDSRGYGGRGGRRDSSGGSSNGGRGGGGGRSGGGGGRNSSGGSNSGGGRRNSSGSRGYR